MTITEDIMALLDANASHDTERKTMPETIGSRSVSSGTKVRRVIVAEDDPAMRALIVDWLASDGYAVVECATGHELVNQLSFLFTNERDSIDVIISDVRMPGLDGLEALEIFHSRALPPIILITAFGTEETVLRARRLGAMTILHKPFDRDDLMIIVHWVAPFS